MVSIYHYEQIMKLAYQSNQITVYDVVNNVQHFLKRNVESSNAGTREASEALVKLEEAGFLKAVGLRGRAKIYVPALSQEEYQKKLLEKGLPTDETYEIL
ncbi:MAG: hypothetical protein HY929_04060 [Euryarchaeota archaeon]|nr:hypothetical protein [Euryarchaeota archaeon]